MEIAGHEEWKATVHISVDDGNGLIYHLYRAELLAFEDKHFFRVGGQNGERRRAKRHFRTTESLHNVL